MLLRLSAGRLGVPGAGLGLVPQPLGLQLCPLGLGLGLGRVRIVFARLEPGPRLLLAQLGRFRPIRLGPPPPPEHHAHSSLKTYVRRVGPVSVGPYQTVKKTDVVKPPPVKGAIVGMDVRMVDERGRVIPQNEVMLHHNVFTNGGPSGSTEVVMTLVYKLGLERNELGVAAAGSMVLLGATVVLTLAVQAVRRREER